MFYMSDELVLGPRQLYGKRNETGLVGWWGEGRTFKKRTCFKKFYRYAYISTFLL